MANRREASPDASARASAPDGELRARRAAGWFAVALATLLPLVFWPPAFGPFHAAKWLVVLVVVPGGLAVCAAGGELRWPCWRWFVPWVTVAVLSTAFGVAPWMSVFGSPNRNAGLLGTAVGIGAFVLGASVGGDGVVQRRLLRATMLTAGLVGLLAVAERFGLDLAGLGDAGEITRARSTWGSATFAGAHLALVLPIALAHLRSRDPRWRLAAIACSGATVAGLVATGTRAAWLAALFATALLYPAWRATAPGGGAERPADGTTRRTAAAVAALVLVVAAVVGALGTVDFDRASAVGRLDLWSTTPTVVADRPLLGWGPDTQRVALPAGIDEEFERDHGSEELHDRAHSLPLDTLVTTGFLGLLALGTLLWVLGREVVSRLRRQLVPTAVAAGLAAYLVTLLFAFGDPVLDPLAWVLAGLVLATTDAAGTGDDRERTPARIAAAVGLGVVALAGSLWAGGELAAETRLQSAVDATDRGDLRASLDDVSSAATLAPARFDLHQVAARVVTRSLTQGPDLGPQAVDDGFDHLDDAEAVAGDRDPDVLMDLAELLTATGRADDALVVYERVLDAYPHSFRAHLGVGLAQSQVDDLDAAERAWRTAADLAPGDARALVNLGILAERRGDTAAAIGYFERALEVDPDSAAARSGLDRLDPPTG